MLMRQIIDVHMHLNGSFSDEFLTMVAARNGTTEHFLALKDLREKYKVLLQNKASQKELVDNLWAQFFCIQKIVKTLLDIEEGVIDVIKHTKAHYLEIRSTPKAIGQASWQDYVEHFVQGLIAGNRLYADKTLARGLLSLDRCVHDAEQAKSIIDAVVAKKTLNGMLVGIDIGGNFLGKRTLTGDQLAAALNYALKQDIGLAIHIGESDSEIERQDTDVVLDTLEAWQKTQTGNPNPFQGKVRLGHAIFLTDAQVLRIKEMKLAVEVCPTCHEKLGWWNPEQAHPVTRIYNDPMDPVLPGTDDESLFAADAATEMKRLFALFSEYKIEDLDNLAKHQAQYCFHPVPPAKPLQELSPRSSYPPNIHQEINNAQVKQLQQTPSDAPAVNGSELSL